MKSLNLRSVPLVFAVVSLVVASPARAVLLEWSGVVAAVVEDTGAGVFAGAGLGSLFSGFFAYPDLCAAPTCSTNVEPDEADYAFFGPGIGGAVMQGANTVGSPEVFVNVQNDHALDADEAGLASLLLGVPVAAGTLADIWSAGAETSDVFYDPTTEELLQGGVVEIFFFSLDTTLLSDLSFQALPPALGDVDFAGFSVSEALDATLVYEVFGELQTSQVPEPGVLSLLGIGTVALARRRRAAA